ncbi:hypothetical protein CCMA1212_006044 [Trichoderma ghanense]|uniref:Uncharacterized protein n=1 Tax=Trichoderma ghanense TaxID=65468 RepID=A0ABY2H287_9HYPO
MISLGPGPTARSHWEAPPRRGSLHGTENLAQQPRSAAQDLPATWRRGAQARPARPDWDAMAFLRALWLARTR